MAEPALQLAGLTKRFGTSTAVDAIDLAVEDGEFVTLLGPSGCGKTTTLNMIAGFVTHDQSEALTMSDRVAVMREGRIEQIGSPAAVYECPASRFVAGFIGSTNLWPARLADHSGADGLARLETAAGVALVRLPPGSEQTGEPAQGELA